MARTGGELGTLEGRVGPGRSPDRRSRRQGGRAGRGGAPEPLLPRSPRGQTKEPTGGGGNGARGRGAAVSRYRPQRPLTPAPPLEPAPRARAPPIRPLAPPAPGGCVLAANGRRAGAGPRAEWGERRGPIEAVLLKLKILLYANRGGARELWAWDPRV